MLTETYAWAKQSTFNIKFSMLKMTDMRMMKKDIKPAAYLHKIKNNNQWKIAIINTGQFCERNLAITFSQFQL